MFENKKQELLFIKEQLDDSTPKIDISNVYVWKTQHLYSIVKLEIKKNSWNNLFRKRSRWISIYFN